MTHRPVRVVFDNRPYLVTRRADGSLAKAFGPFAPGTEPALAECGPGNEVRSSAIRDALQLLIPRSPEIPAANDTLARG